MCCSACAIENVHGGHKNVFNFKNSKVILMGTCLFKCKDLLAMGSSDKLVHYL